MVRIRKEGQRKLQKAVLEGTLARMIDKAEQLKHEGRWPSEKWVWAAWVVDWWKDLDEDMKEYVSASTLISVFEVIDSDLKQIGISLDRMVRENNRGKNYGRV